MGSCARIALQPLMPESRCFSRGPGEFGPELEMDYGAGAPPRPDRHFPRTLRLLKRRHDEDARSERSLELSIASQDLTAVIAPVEDDEVALRVEGDALWLEELHAPESALAERLLGSARSIKADDFVGAFVGDVEIASGVDRDTER